MHLISKLGSYSDAVIHRRDAVTVSLSAEQLFLGSGSLPTLLRTVTQKQLSEQRAEHEKYMYLGL